MAVSRLSAEDVLANVIDDEESLDGSDSEDGEDIYGYLGAFVVPRGELEDESRVLSRRLLEVDEERLSEDNSEFEGLSEDNEDERSGIAPMEWHDSGRDEDDARVSDSVRMEEPITAISLTEDCENVDETPDVMVNELSPIMMELVSHTYNDEEAQDDAPGEMVSEIMQE